MWTAFGVRGNTQVSDYVQVGFIPPSSLEGVPQSPNASRQDDYGAPQITHIHLEISSPANVPRKPDVPPLLRRHNQSCTVIHPRPHTILRNQPKHPAPLRRRQNIRLVRRRSIPLNPQTSPPSTRHMANVRLKQGAGWDEEKCF